MCFSNAGPEYAIEIIVGVVNSFVSDAIFSLQSCDFACSVSLFFGMKIWRLIDLFVYLK